MTPRPRGTARAAGWSAAHPWRALTAWILFAVVAVLAGGAVGTVQLTSADRTSGDSAKAERALAEHFDAHAAEYVLVDSDRLTVRDAAFRAAVEDVVDRLAASGLTQQLRSPLESDGAGQVSADARAALVTYEIRGDSDTAPDRIDPVLEAIAAAADAHPQLRIAGTGDATMALALEETAGKDFARAETLAIPVTLVVLLIAFGALVAALLPVLLSLTAIAAASGLLALASHLSGVESTASSIMLLIGLAVGVDYCLFYVRREREERAAGASREQALAVAARTSGRAVVVSGVTVLVAMAGMFLTGNAVFFGIATATMLVVATAVLGSVTVLPALLALLGDRVDRGRVPFLRRRRVGPRGTPRLLTAVLRRPVVAAVASAGLLVVLALPALSLRVATPGIDDVPHDIAALQAYDRIQTAFPGSGSPAVVVVTAPDVTAPATAAGIEDLRQRALASGQMDEPIDVQLNSARTAALVRVPLSGSGSDAASQSALRTLRQDVVPGALGDVPGVQAHVTGPTATGADFNDLLRARTPWVFGFVLALAFVVLLASFRSVVVAVKAIVLNLLSVAAAYGAVVAAFQWGWGERALGFTSTGAIASWLPLFLFVILFGLSMDYHVLILSRIRENVDRGSGTTEAVIRGVGSASSVVTVASVVMVAVFAVFVTLSQVSMKELGFGLAVAVALDATVVRCVLLPATMLLLGERNWYLPRWLTWLPDISHADAAEPLPAERPVVPSQPAARSGTMGATVPVAEERPAEPASRR
ncbi:MMPL family transporter [Motilibacter deserti]|uniref:MMPL family transporter n=1 Tax=Motilibacter deserti TaxID=2714956 RepID=A0ABX0H148_9ACTN|nr:MMPL family transporter [Motilibacter deserti]NHC16071.1 MMPL family transporter [Motilibacter deserti]